VEDWEDWQKVYQYGTLVIWPPDQVRKAVNRQRETYDPDSAAICEAHITLTQPLLDSLTESGLEIIQEVAGGFQAFEIHYGPLRSFLPYPCIWYEIQPAEKVLTMREALHQTGLFNLSLEHTEGFIPHMTITEGLSGPAVNERLLVELQEQSLVGSFLCSEAVWILPDKTFSFKIQKHFRMGM
jgi:2'-5' RNA ligase